MGSLGICIELTPDSTPASLDDLVDEVWEPIDELVQAVLDNKFSDGRYDGLLRSSYMHRREATVEYDGSDATLTLEFPDGAGTNTLAAAAWWRWTLLSLALQRREFTRTLEALGYKPTKPMASARVVLATELAGEMDIVHVEDGVAGHVVGEPTLLLLNGEEEEAGLDDNDRVVDAFTRLVQGLWPTDEAAEPWTQGLSEDEKDAWFELAWSLHQGDRNAIARLLALGDRARPYLLWLVAHASYEVRLALLDPQGGIGDRLRWEMFWCTRAEGEDLYEQAEHLFEHLIDLESTQEEQALRGETEYFEVLLELADGDEPARAWARRELAPGEDELEHFGDDIEAAVVRFPRRTAAAIRFCLYGLFDEVYGEPRGEALVTLLADCPAGAVASLVQAMVRDGRDVFAPIVSQLAVG